MKRMKPDEKGVIIFLRSQSGEEKYSSDAIKDIFPSSFLEKLSEKGIGPFEAIIEDDVSSLCYALILPNGHAFGAGPGVQIYGSWPKDKSTHVFHLDWKYILEFRKLDGTILERNWNLCLQCFTLDTVMSDNGIHFCKKCGSTWTKNLEEEELEKTSN
jgi:hypothetical protein